MICTGSIAGAWLAVGNRRPRGSGAPAASIPKCSLLPRQLAAILSPTSGAGSLLPSGLVLRRVDLKLRGVDLDLRRSGAAGAREQSWRRKSASVAVTASFVRRRGVTAAPFFFAFSTRNLRLAEATRAFF
jgi:hypothetical protein